MRIGQSYKQTNVEGPFDAIVIGSGIGGLTTAAVLAKHADKRVLVLEKHYTAGGFTHTFHRPGYEWDVGVHYIGEVHRTGSVMRRVFDDITDSQLAWADMGDVYDTIVIGDDHYDFVKSRRKFRQRMYEYFPRQRQAIDRYLEKITSTARKSMLFFGEKALPPLLSRAVGPLMRRPALRDARRTTAEVLAEITDDARLRGVLAGQYGDYGLPPSQSSFFMHALVAHHYIGGGAYPVGGSSRIAATIEPVINRAGGCVLTSAEVSKILFERGRAVGVEMADGNQFRAPVVISNAGIALTFGRMVPPDIASRAGLRPTVDNAPPSLSHISLYLGLRHSASELGLRPRNLWLYRHHDHDRACAEFMADPKHPFPFTYVSFPSAKDPDFERRYPGRATIEVIAGAPYDWFRRWQDSRWKKRGGDYEQLKQELTERLLADLYRHCPQVEGKLDHCELSTPLSTRHFAGHPQGEIYGLSNTPARFEARWLRPQTPIRGLYLTGSDVCTAGIGSALFAGVLTASSVTRRNMLGTIVGKSSRLSSIGRRLRRARAAVS